MIFDAHAHIYPDAIALKAAHSIAEFYDIPVLCDGTLGTLLEIGAKNDITRFLVHSVAMSPKRTRHIDDYIAQCVREHPDKLVGFGTLHPDSPDIEALRPRRAALAQNVRGFGGPFARADPHGR